MSGESKAYIGLGGNLGNAAETVRTARRAIGAIPGVRELAFSSLYRSAPMGPSDQPDYVNAVMAVATSLAPQALLHALQRIERIHGRVRTGERWGPRTLDLDLLLYDDLVLDTETLRLPHPGIAEREFVLYPLAEIAPDLDIPDRGPLRELVRNCPLRGLSVIAHD
ncbi:2-amino-4-hydroxy-6-hydroxymethyldihydropteridine diphosphokinase [Methylococcus capsulatus]|jgi:2-amino-4-hydroxy-6-hydroxymethyldihydropteridine diphosphokinase|uniref:2-amino-4-hydroxy-6-hydroxymethyldihydropteridine pyrophosphokinase n=2 Tax=Methylococcus capsulatus TaxID=414 RepID=Q605H1_METCA|nr:2-amino-4-hydroxy-6-hydroxymethyldihydropteridine diphosphokinase [Methylococcus capsulatus]AAU91634.1 2-amino-4-hydroxy-6-hydroxymethyldihydropteridine pyrophosphokinase [Methylococcus capsulatus str. Bath]QXP91547.1 2-amino-4-hydroxy-6-hydroxymethyldihydropteridine diphosphokinase [Methylococcus capsulatus]CAI8838272.1 2-amino-4-hydroxy-6-hydroxymethyldihydropteridinediphosphokinase [Methylococcus capsulatus]